MSYHKSITNNYQNVAHGNFLYNNAQIINILVNS